MPPIPNVMELDEIIRQITMAFSSATDRSILRNTNRQIRENIRTGRQMRAAAMMRGAMERYRLTKFLPVTSMDQKIREVVPPIWILATAMSNHATAEDRRIDASGHVRDRYNALDDQRMQTAYDNNDFPTPLSAAERLIEAEGYFYVQYAYGPDRTLREFFQSITNKVHRPPIDVTQRFNAGTMTAPELLRATFTAADLSYYGW